jgi:serpin B
MKNSKYCPYALFILPCVFALIASFGCSDEKSPMQKAVTEAFAASAAYPSRGAVPSTPDAAMLDAAHSNNLFACDLYAQISGNSGNIFFAPISITTALAMTYAGAAGNTSDQMAGVLHFTMTGDNVHEAFGNLDGFIQAASSGLYVSSANTLWGQKDFPFLPDFLMKLKGYYDAPFGELDFAADSESARQVINYWVEEQTRERIKNLMPEGSVNELTRLVLANAIYFKCDWLSPFPSDSTFHADFQPPVGDNVTATMMSQSEEYFMYFEDADWQVVEMPYKEYRYSMVAFLPKNAGALPTPTESMISNAVTNLGNEMFLYLQFPKFTLTKPLDLADILKTMGMADAFDPVKADLSGIDGSYDLYIACVKHKAFIAVTEKGTEAAGATGVGVGTTSAPDGVIFTADHPFFFVIRDTATGAFLFMGRIVDPTQTE